MRPTTGIVKLVLFLWSVFLCTTVFSQRSTESYESIQSALHNSELSHFASFNLNFKTQTKIIRADIFSDTTKKKDRDADGILDSLDKCPDEKGVLQYDGCPIPDSDNDGIADDLDNCPTVAGSAKYRGCPTPDTDGDKINDDEDKCPTVPGVARYGGCLVGDSDEDGVNDDDDKCIDVPGSISNRGCPEILKKNLKESSLKQQTQRVKAKGK